MVTRLNQAAVAEQNAAEIMVQMRTEQPRPLDVFDSLEDIAALCATLQADENHTPEEQEAAIPAWMRRLS